jgi:hypothetical protein
MKQFLPSVVLTGVFCVSTLAGEIPSVPGPQPSGAQSSASFGGDIPSGGKPSIADPLSVSEVALSALLTVLGLASF